MPIHSPVPEGGGGVGVGAGGGGVGFTIGLVVEDVLVGELEATGMVLVSSIIRGLVVVANGVLVEFVLGPVG